MVESVIRTALVRNTDSYWLVAAGVNGHQQYALALSFCCKLAPACQPGVLFTDLSQVLELKKRQQKEAERERRKREKALEKERGERELAAKIKMEHEAYQMQASTLREGYTSYELLPAPDKQAVLHVTRGDIARLHAEIGHMLCSAMHTLVIGLRGCVADSTCGACGWGSWV